MRAVVSSMYAGSSTYPVRYLAVGARSRRSMATTAFPGRGTLERADIELLGSLRSKTASNVAYPLDNGQKKGMLVRLGPIIRELLPHCGKDGMLARLYREQYREVPQSGDGDAKGPEGPVETAVPEPREAKEIPADSLQSVHDPEAAFRRKGHGTGEQKVSGYHANVTETFGGENPFELLTDVRTVAADICEDAFLLPAIGGSDGVLDTGGTGGKTVAHVTTDGGYRFPARATRVQHPVAAPDGRQQEGVLADIGRHRAHIGQQLERVFPAEGLRHVGMVARDLLFARAVALSAEGRLRVVDGLQAVGGDLLGLPWFRHRRFHGPFRALCVPVPALRDFPVLLPVEARQHAVLAAMGQQFPYDRPQPHEHPLLLPVVQRVGDVAGRFRPQRPEKFDVRSLQRAR